MSLRSSQQGSIPLALLASIVVSGLMVVLVGTVLQAERNVRFDRSYTDVIQGADSGIVDAHRYLSHGWLGLEVGETSPVETGPVHNDQEVRWQVERLDERRYEVTSTATTADGTNRTVKSRIEEDALFFPGAFGDQFIALNGASTQIDSYESASPPSACTPASANTCWGTDPDFGTRRGALGTNEDFDFSGNTKVLRAILYNTEGNPVTNATTSNPGGDRCKGNPCGEPGVLGFESDKLDYGSSEQMEFIDKRIEYCDANANDVAVDNEGNALVDAAGNPVTRDQGSWRMGVKHGTYTLSPFRGNGEAGDVVDWENEDWDNYYCADSIEALGDVELSADASPENPVTIFVRNWVKVNGHVYVNCENCPKNLNQKWRDVRPETPALQIFVATQTPSGGADVNISQHAAFAGVIYAPLASCGSSGNAGAHIYGSLICRSVDNVGNWRFHWDEVLGDYGRGTFSVGEWQEDAAAALTN